MNKTEHYRHFLTLTIAAVIGLAASGCGTTKQVVKEEPEPIKKEEPKPEPAKALDFKKSYFEYNQYSLSAADKDALKKAVELLLASPDAKINVDGHCDERGTDEYNVDLGWKRAYAVRDYLKKMGVDQKRLFPASYGRSRPAVIGNDEAAMSKNRRVEISERK